VVYKEETLANQELESFKREANFPREMLNSEYSEEDDTLPTDPALSPPKTDEEDVQAVAKDSKMSENPEEEE